MQAEELTVVAWKVIQNPLMTTDLKLSEEHEHCLCPFYLKENITLLEVCTSLHAGMILENFSIKTEINIISIAPFVQRKSFSLIYDLEVHLANFHTFLTDLGRLCHPGSFTALYEHAAISNCVKLRFGLSAKYGSIVKQKNLSMAPLAVRILLLCFLN